MDILHLIDQLDDLMHNAKPVPLTDQVRVDKDEVYDILDQMRATLPEEIVQARAIVRDRAADTPGADLVGDLAELARLRDSGALTDADFEAAKAKLLGG